MLLRYLPSEDLIGLNSIILTNSNGLSRDERRQKAWSRNHKIRIANALGLYYGATRYSGATIRILVDNIMRTYPQSFLWITPLLNIYFSDVLYHELGHHIHATRRPEYKGKEDAADKWKVSLNRRFLSARYWYLFPVAVVVKLVVDIRNDVVGLVRRLRTRSDS
jgi:hypothetical protein